MLSHLREHMLPFCFLPLFLLLSVDGIVSYFKKQAGPASVELKDEAAFHKFIEDEDASVVGELEVQSPSSNVLLCLHSNM